MRGGRSWHPQRYGGPAATSFRHPNHGQLEGPVHGTYTSGINANDGGMFPPNRDAFVEPEPVKPAEAPGYHPGP